MAVTTNNKQDGLITVQCLAPSSLLPNDIFLAGAQVRVHVGQQAAASGAKIAAAVRGIFTFPALSTDTWADGALVYWDNTNARLTSTASGNTLCGKALGAKTNGQTTADIQLGA